MKITNGIYPTMIVAYTPEGEIDYPAMEKLIEWYIEKGVHGIFALCQSTEIAFLSLEERLKLGKFVMDKVGGLSFSSISFSSQYSIESPGIVVQ